MVLALTVVAVAIACAVVVLVGLALTKRPPGGWARWVRAEASGASRRRPAGELSPAAQAAVDVPLSGLFTLGPPEEAPARRPVTRRPVPAGSTRHARRG